MNLLTHTLDSLWQVVLVGLLLGAGLPSLFALGVRALDTGRGSDGIPTPVARAAAVLCFAVVACAILAGILLLASDFLAGTFGIDIF
ncbi:MULTISPECIES: hypothetical protein [unclassified Rhodococcus (in: high G+C Gram-positive bacteria)]|uniref:hypothetical protein n=1 Tax=unclassified Rhodococcus (in: high G+C Gram-positive bacteria) TaxID=192944 RepID=UPI0007E94743|nr:MULTISPECIES: hypothetical protein [unclassified Rhodococcus (in: high G+C Gram-positive bacteria)]OBA36679.1 hypothetical protein A5767_00930 [Rhodococcus sp. 852002-51564_SCH6189132-a]QXU52720.1 hypothetical protein KXC42_18045 [Rhodococcus sp. LW-XY12]